MTAERVAQLHGILRSMSTVTRLFEARGEYPFKTRALGRRQMDVLFFVSQTEHATVGQLADALRVTSGAVSQILESLQQTGVVLVEVDPADRRNRLVRMTPTAADEVHRFQNDYVNTLLPQFAGLSTPELCELNRLLTKIGVG
jgi:DNA-binding MarR family transcriptional regulator